jgi:hypothetical protein
MGCGCLYWVPSRLWAPVRRALPLLPLSCRPPLHFARARQATCAVVQGAADDLLPVNDVEAAKIASDVNRGTAARCIQFPTRHAGSESVALRAANAPSVASLRFLLPDLPTAFHGRFLQQRLIKQSRPPPLRDANWAGVRHPSQQQTGISLQGYLLQCSIHWVQVLVKLARNFKWDPKVNP